MSNPFENRVPSLNGPVTDVVPVTPNDGVALADVAVALYIETGGAVAFTTVSGSNRVVNVPDFTILPCGATYVLATGTTASGIHSLTVS